jgi:hypothetical protein
MKALKNIDVSGIAIKTACIGGGAYASVKLNKIGFIGKQKPALRGALKIGIGAFAPVILSALKIMKKVPPQVGQIGDGIIAGGTLELATAFDKNLANDISTSIAGIGDLATMGEVVFDETYQSPMSGVGTNDVMGATDGVDYVEM